MTKKKATSSDVAARAGVSQATVSMVLNRKYNVSFSRETVERVEQAARELGYELPGRRKHKADRKEKLIVVFCPTLTSPYYVLLLQGIEAVANEQGYGVFICNTQRDAGLEEKYLRMMQTMRPAGIIYTCNPHPDFQHQVEKIAKETPLVIISAPVDAMATLQFTLVDPKQGQRCRYIDTRFSDGVPGDGEAHISRMDGKVISGTFSGEGISEGRFDIILEKSDTEGGGAVR